ncbi:hypothetical protein [Dickeya fangzhongdai]|uniref:hypothetical protein n=1 Tax=Dickeya fangzhongdai TaxID=1778540 RepID=UPI002B25F44D|nr:hypothetical protein [Dickeya fangzhongdai]WOY02076.1 hypothetical protein OGM22_09880 [Dickeya fangzhongdai]
MDVEITGALLIEAINAALEKKKAGSSNDVVSLNALKREIVPNYTYLINMAALEYPNKARQ